MAFSYTLAGFTFTEENFEGVAYADEDTGFPKALEKIVQHTAQAWQVESDTSLTVGTGSTGVIATDGPRSFAVGQPVTIARTSDPSGTAMFGFITVYDDVSGNMTVDVQSTKGSGTHGDWTISMGGFAETVTAATPVSIANGGTAAGDVATAQSNLDIQFTSTHLNNPGTGTRRLRVAYGGTNANTADDACLSLGAARRNQNLGDLDDAATARTNLGLTSTATTSQGSGNGLDADTVDGDEAADLKARANHTGSQAPGTISPQGAGSGLDADTLDGLHASEIVSGDIPAGSIMLFYNATAPAGWTWANLGASYIVYVAQSAGQGGSQEPGSWTITGVTATGSTEGHALTTNELANHSHTTVSGGASVWTTDTLAAAGNIVELTASPTNIQVTATQTGGAGLNVAHDHDINSVACTGNGSWRPPGRRFASYQKD